MAEAAAVVALATMSKNSGSFASVSFAGRAKGQVLNVTARSSLISLSAHNAPLADVLAAIGRVAGVKVVLRDALTICVTATLINVPLDEAIRRLCCRHSIVLIYDRSTDSASRSALSEVWVASPDPVVTAGRPSRNRIGDDRGGPRQRTGASRRLGHRRRAR